MIRTIHPSTVQRLDFAMVEPVLLQVQQLEFPTFVNVERARLVAAAKADPKKQRAVPVFDAGVPASYRGFTVKMTGKPTVRFCWTVHRNAAGRFVIFRETIFRKRVRRDRFEPILDKRAAIGACRIYRDELIETRRRRAERRANGAPA